MATGHIFLYGEDTVEAVREIRDEALAAINNGYTVEWTTVNTSFKKAYDSRFNLQRILEEANYFLRLYDPVIQALNPIVKRTKVNMIYPV